MPGACKEEHRGWVCAKCGGEKVRSEGELGASPCGILRGILMTLDFILTAKRKWQSLEEKSDMI